METFSSKSAYANLLGLQLKFVVTHFETLPVHPCLRVVIRVLHRCLQSFNVPIPHKHYCCRRTCIELLVLGLYQVLCLYN